MTTRKSLIARAGDLHRNQTEAEAPCGEICQIRIWRERSLDGSTPFEGYVVDSICIEHKLIVEVDGGHHDESQIRVVDRERAA